MKHVIAIALALLHPQMHVGVRAAYVAIIERESKYTGIDGVLMVALVEHESRWIADRVGGLDNQCVGLAQVCLQIYPECRKNFDAPACQERKVTLLDGPANLHIAAQHLVGWRRYCKKLTGHAEMRHILSGYGGADGNGVHCGQKRVHGRWRNAKMASVASEILANYAELQRRTRK